MLGFGTESLRIDNSTGTSEDYGVLLLHSSKENGIKMGVEEQEGEDMFYLICLSTLVRVIYVCLGKNSRSFDLVPATDRK